MPISHLYVPFTEEQHNILTGSMLGDGHLSLCQKNINSHLIIVRSIKDISYLEYEFEIFNNFYSPFTLKNGVKTFYVKNKGYCSLVTIASPSFTQYHNLWYKNKKKIIPKNLQLNAQIIAQWIADDGCVFYNKLPYRFVTEFSTHSFLKEEVEFLANLLNQRYSEEFLVKQKNIKDKKYFIIKAYDNACRAMFHDIDSFFKMKRKKIWDKQESRFWNNCPERQRSCKKQFADHKNLLKEILLNNEKILLKDLSKALNYNYIYNGKYNYNSVNSLLKKYLDNGIVVKSFDKMNNNLCTIIVNKEKINEIF